MTAILIVTCVASAIMFFLFFVLPPMSSQTFGPGQPLSTKQKTKTRRTRQNSVEPAIGKKSAA